MEIEIKGGLKVKINQKNDTCSIIKSSKDTRNVFIPRFAEYEEKKYKIILFDSGAFSGCNIDSLSFAEDSEFEMFEGYCFYGAHIKKLRIPPSVKYMKNGWCNSLHELNEIEISPDNQHFIFYNNEFLLGKSSDNIEKFDVLHYVNHSNLYFFMSFNFEFIFVQSSSDPSIVTYGKPQPPQLTLYLK